MLTCVRHWNSAAGSGPCRTCLGRPRPLPSLTRFAAAHRATLHRRRDVLHFVSRPLGDLTHFFCFRARFGAMVSLRARNDARVGRRFDSSIHTRDLVDPRLTSVDALSGVRR